MDEEAYRKNLVDEARKECELVQNEMDQLESEVDSTVQMCFIFDLSLSVRFGVLPSTWHVLVLTRNCSAVGELSDN
ncbi:unnamed protein product [Toxocara canis]|uniref:Tubulin-specific chaperone A n=1 Tax=Toxocara canis TaxID=6265 RepID=A0A183U9N6_TOXCA|nr:unnamed protein product [Toxocara canis]